MNTFTLSLSDVKPTPKNGLNTGVDTNEHEGIPFGVSERISPDFTVRLASGDYAPIAEGGVITKASLRPADEMGTKEQALWLTKPTSDDENASLVKVEDYIGYTRLAGKNTVEAAGPDTALIRMRPNSAIMFVTRDGRKLVLFTNDDARQPQIAVSSQFSFDRLRSSTPSPSGSAVSRR